MMSVSRIAFILAVMQGQYSQAQKPILEAVDQAYFEIQTKLTDRHMNQMTLVREQTGRVDQCRVSTVVTSFGQAIESAIRTHLKAIPFQFPANVNKAYQIELGPGTQAVSLISHPHCPVTEKSLEHMIGKDFVPAKTVIQSLQKFTGLINQAVKAKNEKLVTALYTGLMGCIAYEEALAVPGDFGPGKIKMDTAFAEYLDTHKSIAKNFQKKNPETDQIETLRPSGIIAYIDRQGGYAIEYRKLKAMVDKLKAEGKYDAKVELWFMAQVDVLKAKFPSWPVLGIFQFTPDGFGNIRACIESWNELNPKCSISKGSKDSVAMALVSPGQAFNTFCGVQKIVHAFYSQVNTSSPIGTDLSNVLNLESSEIKPSIERCVSIVSRSGTGRVYSHFGPLRNSVKDNLGHVFKCVERAIQLHLPKK